MVAQRTHEIGRRAFLLSAAGLALAPILVSRPEALAASGHGNAPASEPAANQSPSGEATTMNAIPQELKNIPPEFTSPAQPPGTLIELHYDT